METGQVGSQGLPATPPVNNDGVLGTYETNWTVRDTDGDRLWDGFDYYTNPDGPSWHYGELFLVDYNWRSFFQNANQSDDSNATVADTDGDGLDDGDEVYGWGKDIYVLLPGDTDTFDNLTSDPSLSDSDSDGLNDSAEYNYDAHPLITDTDEDGLRDNLEKTYGTIAADFDTDNDMIPDGYVEDWWRGSNGVWTIDDTGNNDGDTSANCWEGEDLDLDGSHDSGETNASDADTDGDGIKDGYEYFFDYVIGIMDPTEEFNTGNDNYDADGDTINNALDTTSDGDDLDDNEEDVNGDGAMEATASGSTYPDDYTSAYETNPYDTDTDGDSEDDDEDLLDGVTPVFDHDIDGDKLICAVDEDSDGDGANDGIDPYPLDNSNAGDTDGYPNLGWDDPDNDDDGLTDAEEDIDEDGSYNNDDPSDKDDADTDDDGLDDLEEREYGTRADLADTDSDGIDDDEEVVSGSDGYVTDPNDPDSDGDGLNDGAEISFSSDPNDEDSDDDLLNDYQEQSNNCNPNLADTDGDTLTDYQEVEFGTEPDDKDTDDDGLTDGPVSDWYFSNDLFDAGCVVSSETTQPGFGPASAMKNDMVPAQDGEDRNCNGIVDYDKINEYFETDPKTKYSDEDSYDDGYEVFVTKTIAAGPGKPDDSDGDGIGDDEDYFQLIGTEIGFAVRVFGVESYCDNFDGDIYPEFQLIVDIWCDADNNLEFDDSCDKHYDPPADEWKENGDWIQDLVIYDTKIKHMDSIPQDCRFIKVKIKITDKDWKKSDSNADIAFEDGSDCALYLYYDMAYGLWSDVSPKDQDKFVHPNEGAYIDKFGNLFNEWDSENPGFGIGYSTGYGDIDKDGEGTKNAGVYFDMYPCVLDDESSHGDFDEDGLPDKAELFWKTDPEEMFSRSADFPDWYSTIHGLMYTQHISDPNLPSGDSDNDGIDNTDEFDLRRFGANPNRKDVFVEIDWMINPNSGEDYNIDPFAKYMMIEELMKHEIGIHIDDGCMKKGSDVYYNEWTFFGENKDDSESRGLSGKGPYNDIMDFKDSHFISQRESHFHYVVSCSYISINDDGYFADWSGNEVSLKGPDGSGDGIYCPDEDVIALGHQNWIDDGYSSTHIAYVLMHELGHSYGIDDEHPWWGDVMFGSRMASDKGRLGYGRYWSTLDLSANLKEEVN